jgi:hypothetical protein
VGAVCEIPGWGGGGIVWCGRVGKFCPPNAVPAAALAPAAHGKHLCLYLCYFVPLRGVFNGNLCTDNGGDTHLVSAAIVGL